MTLQAMPSLISNLISYWPLHESSGTRYDATGQSNDLADINTVTQARGPVVYAAEFDKNNQEKLFISNADSNSSLQSGDIDLTIACWVYLYSKGAAIVRTFAAKMTNPLPREYALVYFNIASTDRLSFQVHDGTNPDAIEANALGSPALNTWYFVVGIHDSINNIIAVEIDGQHYNQKAFSTGLAATLSNFFVGIVGPDDSRMDGRVAELGVWKRVLTQQERVWLYNKGRGRTYPFDGRPSLGVGRRARRNMRTGIAT